MTTVQTAENAIRHMLELHPSKPTRALDETAQAIEACMDCTWTCSACADESLAEPDVSELIKSIGLCTDCGEICATTGRMLARQTDTDRNVFRSQVGACIEMCRACATECEKHAMHHEHHRICGETCRRCEAACTRLLQVA